jgi:hypothetical protein
MHGHAAHAVLAHQASAAADVEEGERGKRGERRERIGTPACAFKRDLKQECSRRARHEADNVAPCN